MSLGIGKKKKKSYTEWRYGTHQIVWKILSDGKWVMVPNRCEKLSDEWWVMEIEWQKLSDEKNSSKQPLNFQISKIKAKKGPNQIKLS